MQFICVEVNLLIYMLLASRTMFIKHEVTFAISKEQDHIL